MRTSGAWLRISVVSKIGYFRGHSVRVALGSLLVLLEGVVVLGLSGGEIRFAGPEIFPIEHRIQHLEAADFNSDGYLDLVVVNPRRSRLQILYNQSAELSTGQAIESQAVLDTNDLPIDARFRLASISTEERVTSVVVTDFLGDEELDIAYCGNLDEVVLLENRGTQGWVESMKWSIPAIVPSPDAIQVGDFNGDGDLELVVLTENDFSFIDRTTQGEDTRPRGVRHSGDLKSFRVIDLNGDGIDDIVSRASDSTKHHFIRLGGAKGISVSELVVKVDLNRFLGVVDPEAAEFVSISQRSGRAKIGKFKSKPVRILEKLIGDGQLNRVALPPGSQTRPGTLSRDINGDQLTDLIVADVQSGKLLVYLQSADRLYGAPSEFGSYGGIGQLEGADWDRDGSQDLFLLSYSEKQVGITKWTPEGGIPFPSPVELQGVPLGMVVRPPVGDELGQLFILERFDSRLNLVVVDADSTMRQYTLDVPVESSRVELVLHDADQDGLQDIVVIAPYEELWVLRQKSPSGLGYETIKVSGGARDLEHPWVGRIDVDGDGKNELVLPQGNAVRGLVLESRTLEAGDARAWKSRIKVQINGAESDSIIGGISSIPVSEGERPIVCLLDIANNRLSCQQQGIDGQWNQKASFELPRADYIGMDDTVLDVAGTVALRISGLGGSFLKFLGDERWVFDIEGTYETQLAGGFLGRCIGADFDGDDLSELIFLETAKHNIEIVSLQGDEGSKLMYRWPVFESRTFRNRRNELPEPREALVADFTGDDRSDLMLLVHDRLLLYPQH